MYVLYAYMYVCIRIYFPKLVIAISIVQSKISVDGYVSLSFNIGRNLKA